jgi:hypothetical protein
MIVVRLMASNLPEQLVLSSSDRQNDETLSGVVHRKIVR